jgi:hypothetical protein
MVEEGSLKDAGLFNPSDKPFHCFEFCLSGFSWSEVLLFPQIAGESLVLGAEYCAWDL